ncbi:polar amino acid ABC transporter, inner membrane subunit [Cellulomonas flavigena DSM 20109]|uniref:Polar amino acid ABC transporter, inner membrane subunit n=1 Tax=Cellulomonas flavigena (strain ATCC 482 / DSM 20109 / BCRC 11376 / JCM 18109 / NBRC 3775 / NCIMB 8073 / NRS 134) TaxID=446466 RepID=D5UDA9_CELFN|nr:amino acid ABC transporter permease [Cellulomonas flavigena]ADG74446.1 polar amino acid ABC transporter, inner membrane subunit [Cellulomonas flavigena DSM 20109]
MSRTTSILYDAPGPRARRRELVGSVVAALVVLAVVGLGVWYAAGRGVFDPERWAVLWDPPKNQSAADVWRSLLVLGLGATLRAAAVAAPLAFVLGLLLAVWRTTRFTAARGVASAIIELFRGLPVLLMMFFALLGFGWSAFAAVVFGLTVYNMAIIAEIVRAGLASLPKGQSEAAYAVGLSRGQTLRLVLLPQALRTMAPSLVAQLVVLLKDSSLGFIVGYAELLNAIKNNAQYFGNTSVVALFAVGAGTYLVVNIALSRLAMRLQGRSPRTAAAPVDATVPGTTSTTSTPA